MRIGMGCHMTGKKEQFPINYRKTEEMNRSSYINTEITTDIVLHEAVWAVMDALFGAAALGDARRHFLKDNENEQVSSDFELLKRTGDILEEKLFVISNMDIGIITSNMDLSDDLEKIQEKLAKTLRIENDQVNVKMMQAGIGVSKVEGSVIVQAIASIDSIENFSYSVDLTELQSKCAGCHGCQRGEAV